MYIELNIELRTKQEGDWEDEEWYRTDRFSSEERKTVELFEGSFQKYHVRRRRQYSYKLTTKDEDYEEFWNFHEKYKKKLNIVITGYILYEQEDLEAADAFLLTFKKGCYYYDDWNEEKYDCMETVSPALGQWHPKPPIYLKLPIKTKRLFAQGMAGADTPDGENYISPALHQYLLSCGVDKEFFRPAFAKSNLNEPIAWRLWGADHVLPQESFMPFENPEEKIWLQDADTGYVKWIWNELDENVDEEMPDWEFYMNGDFILYKMTLNKEGMERLTYVNEAYECIGNIRPTIINKELFWMIAKQVPEIKKYSEPIFFSEHPKGGYKKLQIRGIC